ncbi:solute carrier family 28 member 3-like isoform X2 [Liolophura sinensis]
MDSMKPMSSTPNGKICGPFSNGVLPSEKSTTPIAPIWVPAPLGYHAGKSSVCRKLPESDQVEIEVTMSEDSNSNSTNPSDSSWSKLLGLQLKVGSFVGEKSSVIFKVCVVIFLALYCAYFAWALLLNHRRATPLIVMTSLIVVGLLFSLVKRKVGPSLHKTMRNLNLAIDLKWHVLKWIVYPIIFLCVAGVIAYKVWDRPENLVSLGGLVFFLMILFIFSARSSQVKWRPVLWGLGLQMALAMFIQWECGYEVFRFLGSQVQTFLSYTDEGSSFVFGQKFTEHPFAFKVLPVIIFFSCTISVLYHLGVMQIVIGAIAWVMRVTLGTTAAESLSAAGNIFVGQTEAPILIRPYLELMTKSELHAIMTGGFATIAGGVLAAYILFGIPAEHLICASVMNAPCALAVSKLFYPETEESKLAKATDLPQQEKKERNVLEAAASGASSAIMLVANVAANLIAFLAMLAFVNAMLGWFGSMVDHPELSFQLICSYIFMPVAFLMGVDWEDAGIIGELIGIKTFLNEFVAYKDLSVYIANRKACIQPAISMRSEVIATYALCGFANLSSIGIQLGGIGPMAPNRKGDLASIALRALTAGIITSLITSCVAGLLIVEDPVTLCQMPVNVTEVLNVTSFINGTDLML